MNNLKKEFSDLSVSTLNDVTQACDNNPALAAEMLRGIAQEERRKKEEKIDALHKQFHDLPREVVATVLAEHKYDDDAALFPLYEKLNDKKKKQEEAEKKKRQDREKKRRQAEVKEQIRNLMDVFQTIPKDTIQKILDENEGDLQATTDQLLVIVSAQDDVKRKQIEKQQQLAEQEDQAQKGKELRIEGLKAKFPELSYDEIVQALESNNWDIRQSCKYLVVYIAQRKAVELGALFPEFTEDEIQGALQSNNWEMMDAVRSLTEVRENRKREVEERIKAEQEAFLSINAYKIQQSLLERSIMVGQEVEQAVNKQEETQKKVQEEEARGQFKKELEHILTVQAQNGTMPGLVPPPLPKEIDALLGKARPVEEEPVQAVADNKPSPVSVSQERNDTKKDSLNVILRTADVVDCGNSITVEWEIVSGNSTAYDWIGFYAAGQPNKSYITYDWRGKAESKGSLTFTAPANYGVYEFRYFPSSSYEHAAMSNKVVVGPQVDLVASFDKESKKFKVTWNQKSGNEYRRCWIGLFEKTAPNKQFITWEYAVKAGVEMTFDAPVKPVEYEFRFFPYGYIDVARSNTIRVEGQDKLSASFKDGQAIVKVNIVTVDPATDGVWIGLFFTEQADNRQWRRYKYVSDRTSDVIFKSPPRTGGQYEARLFANKTFDCILKSDPFQIPDQK